MLTRLIAVLATVALALGLAPAAVAAPADWDDLGLAHADRRIHFEGNSMPRPSRQELSAIAVTADSAVVLVGGPNRRGNRLVELPAGTGEPRVIGRFVRGLPVADVAGHRVFWTSRHGHGDFRLHAYDTSTGTSHERALGRVRWIVGAVDGDTAYGAPIGWGRWRSWTPETGFQAVDLPEEVFVTDVADGAVAFFLFNSEEGTSIVGPGGAEVASDVDGWLTFDPTGAYAAQVGEWGIGVWDVAHGRSIELAGLDDRRWFAPVWAANGELVVTTFTSRRDERDWDDANPVRHYRCPMSDDAVTECTLVPTRQPHATWFDPVFGATSLDQLMALELFS